MAEVEYESLLEDIRDTLQGAENKEKPIEANDNKLNLSTASQREKDEEYDNRNRLYTQLLEKYIKIYEKKEIAKTLYKAIFFGITIFLFFGIEVCCLAGIVYLSVKGNGWESVGIAIGNVAGVISTLIVLPKIIAEHLFPTNEENNMIGMVKNMQENDANIRKIIYGETDEE